MYRYETHLHTSPVSKCAVADVRQTVEFYKALGYAGIFVTNHFLDGNINISRDVPYEEKIEFYFSDYEAARELGEQVGLQVFCGVELSYGGTDFLIYGLSKQWYLEHPEILQLRKSQELRMMWEAGALIIQAHPFRELSYIDHIRLYPRNVHGVEIINASNLDFANDMAAHYAESYKLIPFAGSDNHSAYRKPRLAGVEFDTPVTDVQDFMERILDKEHRLFSMENPLQK